MSTRDVVNSLCADGRLRRLTTMQGAAQLRTLCVAEDIARLLDGPWDSETEATRWKQAAIRLDFFMRDARIPLPKKPAKVGKSKTGLLALLAPAENEIWEIRCLEPPPGLRLFGRFSAQDEFVAVSWAKREDLGYDQTLWDEAIGKAQTRWKNLFLPGYEPIAGSYPNDYVTKFYLL